MRAFSDAFLDDYLAACGEALLGSVGGYHIEGMGLQLFDRVEGDYFTVLGLPMAGLLGALRQRGVIAVMSASAARRVWSPGWWGALWPIP